MRGSEYAADWLMGFVIHRRPLRSQRAGTASISYSRIGRSRGVGGRLTSSSVPFRMGLAGYLVGPGSGELDLVLLAVSRNWTLMNLPSLSQSMLNRGEGSRSPNSRRTNCRTSDLALDQPTNWNLGLVRSRIENIIISYDMPVGGLSHSGAVEAICERKQWCSLNTGGAGTPKKARGVPPCVLTRMAAGKQLDALYMIGLVLSRESAH
jgi:hypothetical protein